MRVRLLILLLLATVALADLPCPVTIYGSDCTSCKDGSKTCQVGDGRPGICSDSYMYTNLQAAPSTKAFKCDPTIHNTNPNAIAKFAELNFGCSTQAKQCRINAQVTGINNKNRSLQCIASECTFTQYSDIISRPSVSSCKYTKCSCPGDSPMESLCPLIANGIDTLMTLVTGATGRPSIFTCQKQMNGLPPLCSFEIAKVPFLDMSAECEATTCTALPLSPPPPPPSSPSPPPPSPPSPPPPFPPSPLPPSPDEDYAMDLWPWIDNYDNNGDHENIINLDPAPAPSSEKDGDEGADIIAPTPTPPVTEKDEFVDISIAAPAPSPLEDEQQQDVYDDYYSASGPSMLPW